MFNWVLNTPLTFFVFMGTCLRGCVTKVLQNAKLMKNRGIFRTQYLQKRSIIGVRLGFQCTSTKHQYIAKNLFLDWLLVSGVAVSLFKNLQHVLFAGESKDYFPRVIRNLFLLLRGWQFSIKSKCHEQSDKFIIQKIQPVNITAWNMLEHEFFWSLFFRIRTELVWKTHILVYFMQCMANNEMNILSSLVSPRVSENLAF